MRSLRLFCLLAIIIMDRIILKWFPEDIVETMKLEYSPDYPSDDNLSLVWFCADLNGVTLKFAAPCLKILTCGFLL